MAVDSTAQVTVVADATSKPAPLPAFNHSDGPSFSDVLDIINPLHHIPIISTIYEHLTGDTEGAVAEVAGDTLWTGPIGLVGSLIDLAVRDDTGKSISDNLLSWLGLDGDGDTQAAVAQNNANTPANPASPAAQVAQQNAVASALPPAVMVQNLPAPGKSRAAIDKAEPVQDSDDDAPQKVGDFLVFGAAGSAQPKMVAQNAPRPSGAAPNQSSATPIGQQGGYMVFGGNAGGNNQPAQAAPRPAPVTSASANPAGVMTAGNYLVFGAGQPAASSPAPLPTPTVPTATAATAMAAAATNSTPTGLTPLPARSFPVPARRNPVVPSTLPPPTTGPAALPGHGLSQAIPASAANNDWFTNAVNAGLDKYQTAQRLTDPDVVASAAGQSATIH